jgi:hypothetical protein
MKGDNERGAVAYTSDEEVEGVLRRFEAGEFVPDDFKHRHHLDAALLYVLRHGEAEALALMRGSLLRFLSGHGLGESVYHETITAFWVRRVAAFVACAQTGRPVHELANELARECADPRLVFDYYSRELIDSKEARAGWVEPDLKEFDF